jgi:hypothetical protein
MRMFPGRNHVRLERAGVLTVTLLPLLSLFTLTAASFADSTMSWNAPGGGFWSEAGNWYPEQVPDRSDEAAVISIGGAYQVTIDTRVWPHTVEVSNPAVLLRILDWAELGAGTVDNHGTIESTARHCGLGPDVLNHPDGKIRIPSGTTLTFNGGTVTNNGVIDVNSDHGFDYAEYGINDPDGMTLAGFGQVVLHGDGDPSRAIVTSVQGTGWTQEADHTIHGDGTISAPITNHGMISSDVVGSAIVLSDGTKTNTGTLETLSGAKLDIMTNVVQSGQGTIRAVNGTIRVFNSSRIERGYVVTTNGGRLVGQPGAFVIGNSTCDATIDVPAGCRLIAGFDRLVNNGTINLNPDGLGDDAVLQGYQYYNVVLDGTGQVVMKTGGDPGDARLETTGETIVNGPLHTIRGEGSITCPFDNHGRISADVNERTLQLVGGPKQNDSTIEARSQGILEISGCQVQQSGAGTMLADGATVNLQSGGSISGGILTSSDGGHFVTQSGTTGIYNLTNNAAIDVTGGTQMRIGYGTIVNNGTITLNPGQIPDNAILACCDYCNVTIDGTGEIVMRTAGDVEDAELVTYGWYTVNGPAHTIRGEGAIHTTLQNQGALRADANGRTLLSTSEVTNSGLAIATDGGKLEIAARFVNQGIAEASSGGTARFANISANYGGNNLQGGAWRVLSNSVMRLLGADIHTLTADLLLDGAESNLYSDDATSSALGNLSAIADGGKLEIRNRRNLAVPGALTNAGTLALGAGSTLTVPGIFSQQGDATHGHTSVDGLLASAHTVQLDGGVLDGVGTIGGGLRSAGDVRPGHSPGTLTVEGDYEQAAGGVLTIELAGLGAAQFDRLAVTGQAVLGGTLAVRAIDGFQAHAGDTFVVLTRGGGSGTFATVTSDLGSGLMATVEYAATTVTVRIQTNPADVQEPGSPEDANGGDGGAGDGGAGGAAASVPTALRLSARASETGSAILLLDLPEGADVRVRIHDLGGRVVAELANRAFSAGSHDLHWGGVTDDGRRLSSGVYFARADVRGAHGVETRRTRVILLR